MLPLLALSLVLNLGNNRFPLSYHMDEGKKATYVVSGRQDFYHPILLLQIGRAARAVLGGTDRFPLVVRGRTTNGLLATVAAGVAWLLARRTMRPGLAVAMAASFGLSPLLVIHAHYYKEDILLVLFIVLSMLCLERVMATGRRRWTVLLGLASGLAFSSKYIAWLLPVLYALGIAFLPPGRRAAYARRAAAAVALGTAVFAAVNFPLFADPQRFRAGVWREWLHATSGHLLFQLRPLSTVLMFHLRESLLPGLTAPLLAFSLVGLAALAARWRRAAPFDRLMAAGAALFYLAIEISPLKLIPDAMRYALPAAFFLVYCAYRGVDLWLGEPPRPAAMRVVGPAAAVVVCWALAVSALLVVHLERDTRERARIYIQGLDGTTVSEWYGPIESDTDCLGKLNVQKVRDQGVSYLAASSLMYDRYLYAARFRESSRRVKQRAEKYGTLFAYPCHEIRPAFRSFALSNPTIRIIDIRKEPIPTP